MTTRTASDTADPQIDSRDDLLPLCIKGEKPKSAWRIGTEHEKFVYRRSDHRAPSYDEPGGIRDLLEALACCGQWQPVIAGGNAIALAGPGGPVRREPAGQLEPSGAQLVALHPTSSHAGRHPASCHEAGARPGPRFLGFRIVRAHTPPTPPCPP